MTHLTALEFADLHGDPAHEFDAGELYCNACGAKFVPVEETSQKDDHCICRECAEAIEKMKEGKIA